MDLLITLGIVGTAYIVTVITCKGLYHLITTWGR